LMDLQTNMQGPGNVTESSQSRGLPSSLAKTTAINASASMIMTVDST